MPDLEHKGRRPVEPIITEPIVIQPEDVNILIADFREAIKNQARFALGAHLPRSRRSASDLDMKDSQMASTSHMFRAMVYRQIFSVLGITEQTALVEEKALREVQEEIFDR